MAGENLANGAEKIVEETKVWFRPRFHAIPLPRGRKRILPGLRPLMLRGKVCTSKNERNQEFFQMFPTSRSKPQSLGNVIEMSMPLGKNVRVTNRNFFTTASLVSSILFSETGCVFRGCLRSPSTVKHRSGPRAEMLACFVLVLRRCSQSQYSSPRKH